MRFEIHFELRPAFTSVKGRKFTTLINSDMDSKDMVVRNFDLNITVCWFASVQNYITESFTALLLSLKTLNCSTFGKDQVRCQYQLSTCYFV